MPCPGLEVLKDEESPESDVPEHWQNQGTQPDAESRDLSNPRSQRIQELKEFQN
jgi:hypothetical protein